MVASTDDSILFKKFARVARVDERSQWSINNQVVSIRNVSIVPDGGRVLLRHCHYIHNIWDFL